MGGVRGISILTSTARGYLWRNEYETKNYPKKDIPPLVLLLPRLNDTLVATVASSGYPEQYFLVEFNIQAMKVDQTFVKALAWWTNLRFVVLFDCCWRGVLELSTAVMLTFRELGV